MHTPYYVEITIDPDGQGLETSQIQFEALKDKNLNLEQAQMAAAQISGGGYFYAEDENAKDSAYRFYPPHTIRHIRLLPGSIIQAPPGLKLIKE